MNQRAALSEARPIPRRGLSREEAAMYVGVGSTKFDAMVADGRMPRPKRIDSLRIWDVRQLWAHMEPAEEEREAHPPRIETCHEVYVVGFSDFVKIGYSSKFVNRLADLQSGVPIPLVVYARFQGRQTQERALHRRFDKHRLNGEWFRLEGDLERWIKEGCPRG